MTLFYASVKSASCFAVVAFTTSTTVQRFGRTSEIVLVTRRFGHKIDFSPEQIKTFESRIEKLELPKPTSFDINDVYSRLEALSDAPAIDMDKRISFLEAKVADGQRGSDEIHKPLQMPDLYSQLTAVGQRGAHESPEPPQPTVRRFDERIGLMSSGPNIDTIVKSLRPIVGFFRWRRDDAAKGADSAVKEREIAVVVGSQINVCESDVESDLKDLVHSFMLLAQLVARNKARDKSDAYWAAYRNTLVNNGWLETRHVEVRTASFENNIFIHQQIVPFLAAAFVPATPATSILTGIIQGLSGMDATSPSPWIRLFSRASTKTEGASFQFSTTSISSDNKILLDLVGVSITAGEAYTQALFARHEATNARLEIDQRRLETTPSYLRKLKATLEKKAAPYMESESASIFVLE